MTQSLSLFLFQLAIVLFAAKVGGEVFQRYLKQPPVLGELAMGMLIGPFALGSLPIPIIGPLFPYSAPGGFGVSSGQLYFIAQVAIIILLFSAGLGTDFRQFFHYAGPAALVAAGGAAVSFLFGAWATVLFGLSNSITSPVALFVGAIICSTSVGTAARILKDIGKLGTPEGVTILAADVLDDVAGILILTLVMGLATAGAFQTAEVLFNISKAIGFWVLFTTICIISAKYIARFLLAFKVVGAALALALALALFSGGLAEQFGLATVIGAYSLGLALSDTKLPGVLAKSVDTLHHVFVPVFFVVMGMLVDFRAVGGVFFFGLAVSILAIAGKLIGCGLPSLTIGFNRRGAARIGFGMVPRGEVSLIIAGVGLTRGIIPAEVFGISVMVIMVTTLVTPVMLAALFSSGGEGSRSGEAQQITKLQETITKQ